MKTYDMIIAGASFAGLVVAAQLRGKRVLLLDNNPVGTGQTSAWGTLVVTLRALGLEAAILQVHDRLVFHTPGRTFVYPVAEPFCTFDYAALCRLLRARGDAEFRQAAAFGWPARRLLSAHPARSGSRRPVPGRGRGRAVPGTDRRGHPPGPLLRDPPGPAAASGAGRHDAPGGSPDRLPGAGGGPQAGLRLAVPGPTAAAPPATCPWWKA